MMSRFDENRTMDEDADDFPAEGDGIPEEESIGLEERADYSETRLPPECAGQRLDVALARLFPGHSRARLQGWLKDGLILLDGVQVQARQKVWGGEIVRLVHPPPPVSGDTAEAIALSIRHEDEAIIVIDKPAGLVVHPGNGNPGGTLLNALLHHAPALAAVPRAGIVHRLDKETTGLLVVAKTLEAQTVLVRQLQAREVSRHYLALVHGAVSANGTVDAPLGRHPVHRTRMAVLKTGGKTARTHYAVREHLPGCTLLDCQLETGRTHQIRVHLASIHHPLVGDPVYGKTCSGNPRLDAFPRQALHACRLALTHPVSGARLRWEAPPPVDFSDLLAALRASDGH